MKRIPETAVKMPQDGLMWNILHFGGEIFVLDGYHFYNKQVLENYDERGNLVPSADRVWCTYMTCVCKTAEEANEHIIAEKI